MVAVRTLALATAKAMLTIVLRMTVAIERTAVADAALGGFACSMTPPRALKRAHP